MSDREITAMARNLLHVVKEYGIAKVTKNKDRNKDNRLEKVFIDLNKLNENKIVKVYENQDEILILANETKIKHSFII